MIAIPVENRDVNPKISERFGRSPLFAIIEGYRIVEIIENPHINQPSGAGGATVQLLTQNNVDVIISPNIGPKAMDVINKLAIEVLDKGEYKTVNSALEAYRNKLLKGFETPKTGLRRV